MPPSLGAWSLSHWSTRGVLACLFNVHAERQLLKQYIQTLSKVLFGRGSRLPPCFRVMKITLERPTHVHTVCVSCHHSAS